MNKESPSKIDQEVRNAIHEPDDYEEMLQKMIFNIEKKKKSIEDLTGSIKQLKFQHFLNKISRRGYLNDEKAEKPRRSQSSQENIPSLYLVFLTVGISLFFFSIFQGILKDSKFSLA